MKVLLLGLTALMLFLAACGDDDGGADAAGNPTLKPSADGVYGVFEGRVPCEATALPIVTTTTVPTPGVPVGCEKIKTYLVLRSDPATGEPTTYALGRVGVGVGNDRLVTRGNWSISTGTAADPDAVVYQLDDATPPEFRYYMAVDENILLFLDEDGNLVVGNPSWSYTLNRSGNASVTELLN